MGCSSWHILSGINPVLHMIFTFMQMYYLFMHSRLNINKNKIIAKFGLMHLLVGSYLSNKAWQNFSSTGNKLLYLDPNSCQVKIEKKCVIENEIKRTDLFFLTNFFLEMKCEF